MNKAYAIPHDTTKVNYKTFDYRVFIVDDSYSSRALLENYLKKLPSYREGNKPVLDIHTFSSGEDCVSCLYLKPDIVVLDHHLNEQDTSAMNGLSVLKQIKAKRPSTKIIAMSGQDSVIITSEFFHNGADDYVSKEHSCNTLVEHSVVRLIHSIEKERKSKFQTFLLVFVLAIFSFLVGYIL